VNVKSAIVQCRGVASRCSAHVLPAEVVMKKRGPWITLTHVRAFRTSKPLDRTMYGARLPTHDDPPFVVTCNAIPQRQI